MNGQGRPIKDEANFKPYQLRQLMQKYSLHASDFPLPQEIGFRVGQNLAPATFSMLINRHLWPRSITRETIESVVASVLASKGATPEEINTAWHIGGQTDAPSDPSNTESQPATKAELQTPFQLPEAEMLSANAREAFGITRHPFQDDVQSAKDLFLSKDQRYIRESMYQAVKHSGFLAVVGESGSGKSTLRRDLIERIRRDNEPIIILQPQTIDKTVLSAAHICDAIITDLSTETPKLSLEAKARQVQRILASSARTGNAHGLIIEEAHDLSVATLKYLKRFWEMEDGFKKLLGIVLIGQPELGDVLDERKNYAAREVIRRCEVARLKSLNGDLEKYLELKLNRVNLKLENVFEKNAFDAIRARLTRKRQGSNELEVNVYPLIVNNLVVNCMNRAAELGMERIDADLISKV